MKKLISIIFAFSCLAQQPVLERNVRTVSPQGCGYYTPGTQGFPVCAPVSTTGSVPTFNHTRIVTDGNGNSCPLFPDDNYWNTDVSSYPQDSQSQKYINYFLPNLISITGASWTSGTATLTVGVNTSTMTNNGLYSVYNVVSTNCTNGGACGYNTAPVTFQNVGFFRITIVDSSHISYPLASDPGTYTSGGNMVGGATLSVSVYSLGANIAFSLNLATNTTPTLTPATVNWGTSGVESDNGAYPWLSTFLIEGYNNTVSGGYIPVTVSGTHSGDQHVMSINMNTCTLYEVFNSSSTSAPWTISNGAIWNLKSDDLRTAHKLIPPSSYDSSGLTSADVAGLPLWPGILQYNEVFNQTAPINHALRLTLDRAGNNFYSGWVWPGTHGNCCNSGGPAGAIFPPLGVRWVLSPTFDTTTCHRSDCAGLPWPSWMQRILTCLQHYGAIFADGGFNLIHVDANPLWGATDNSNNSSGTNWFWQLSGYMKTIWVEDGYFIDTVGHTVSATSGALK